jgi:CBS domain-containing protein
MPVERLLRRPVTTLPPDATCAEAARVMRDENIGCVVVAEEGRPLGVVTDRDLVVRAMAASEDPDKLLLRNVMSGEPVFLGGGRGLDQVLATMRDQGVRRLPIVDDAGQLEGLVSLDDLVVLLSEQLGTLGETVRRELAPPA